METRVRVICRAEKLVENKKPLIISGLVICGGEEFTIEHLTQLLSLIRGINLLNFNSFRQRASEDNHLDKVSD